MYEVCERQANEISCLQNANDKHWRNLQSLGREPVTDGGPPDGGDPNQPDECKKKCEKLQKDID